MRKRILLSILALGVFQHLGMAQSHEIDSLEAVLKKSKRDTNKINTLNKLSWALSKKGNYEKAEEYALLAGNLSKDLDFKKGLAKSLNIIGVGYSNQGNFKKAEEYYFRSLRIKEVIGNQKEITKTLNNIGVNYSDQGDYAKALEYHEKALVIKEELGDKEGIANSYNNIGLIYKIQGDYPTALDYDFKALKIREELGDKSGIANSLNNIGSVYQGQSDYVKSLEYNFKSLKIQQETGDKRGIATSYNNVGDVYEEQGDKIKAIEFYNKSLEIRQDLGDKQGIGSSLNNIGKLYAGQHDYEKALENHFKALAIREEIGDKRGIATSCNNIGKAYLQQHKNAEALKYCTRGLDLAKEIKALDDIKTAEQTISEVYEQSNKPAEAFNHYKAFITARDSILNAENTKKTVQSEMNFSFAKKQAEQKLEQQKKDAITKAIIFAVSGILLLVLLFTIFLVRSSRKISRQRGLLQEKNKEITDSITYAKRIQQAILPPDNQIKKYFPESFVLYKPKDIVAGDFYWMEAIGDNVFFAAADCTGHGVPGAMVSVVCSNALNRAVKEFGLTEPGKILDKTTELVVETFSKSESEVKDGMDISLCSLNISNLEIEWAGANNPLRYTQNGIVKEFAPDKQPIGKYENTKPFRTHKAQLAKGDMLYLFSDGYPDQFGGKEGKKFMRKRFKETLDTNRHLKMIEQGNILNQEFEAWKGDFEQIDDVLVMGVRL